MLHDQLMSSSDSRTDGERRKGRRVPFPAEVTLTWHHDMRSTLRYRLVEAGDGGFRIRSCTPILEGMTGTVLRLLPEGYALDEPVMAVWCRSVAGGFEVGLRKL